MINPLSVLIATPTYDGKVETSYAGGLSQIFAEHLCGNISFVQYCADIALARNMIASSFLASVFDWLVFIDADIGFTAHDFKLLMDYPRLKGQPREEIDDSATLTHPHGDALVSCAEYARKQTPAANVRFGLGFCKIHRSVFVALDKLNLDDGQARLTQFMHAGRFMTDYFIRGPLSGSHWYTEDTGFFSLLKMAGIVPRIEQRTKLTHTGHVSYPYAPIVSATPQ